jgi:hypothetical protein
MKTHLLSLFTSRDVASLQLAIQIFESLEGNSEVGLVELRKDSDLIFLYAMLYNAEWNHGAPLFKYLMSFWLPEKFCFMPFSYTKEGLELPCYHPNKIITKLIDCGLVWAIVRNIHHYSRYLDNFLGLEASYFETLWSAANDIEKSTIIGKISDSNPHLLKDYGANLTTVLTWLKANLHIPMVLSTCLFKSDILKDINKYEQVRACYAAFSMLGIDKIDELLYELGVQFDVVKFVKYKILAPNEIDLSNLNERQLVEFTTRASWFANFKTRYLTVEKLLESGHHILDTIGYPESGFTAERYINTILHVTNHKENNSIKLLPYILL